MKDCLDEFKNRVEEVEKYFTLVSAIDKLETHKFNSLSLPDGDTCDVDSDLKKILKASCYLILYNLIESSVRNGILAIYDAIHDDGLIYKDLNKNIQSIWLEYQSDSFTKLPITKKNVVKNIQEILNSVIENLPIKLEKDKLNFLISGNLNAEKIEQIIRNYGFFGKITVDKKRVKYVLDHVVKMRCDLAHGNASFCQASSNKVMRELIEIKNDVITYLQDLLNNIDDYIQQKKYKRSP
ncbi:hypothetical protein IQ264_19065 [Phormidium sp. LEGE 05292]|uniref:MAE_28990/MAE_18760 family HEPN-like nuclease n=1 Tax=[Phormidium] sp. LEGE 05292 TaxID=767427 RepID=UPI00188246E5|nr:MAE_28990/MAE_18760 family HEPN-like nuclease [Phormidium sp. LEGE 05292]MBE9227533.1 hypothetical protein [Phormidium sp. LEGE 05292]